MDPIKSPSWKTDAYRTGWRAAEIGRARNDNPFKFSSFAEAYDWTAGYDDRMHLARSAVRDFCAYWHPMAGQMVPNYLANADLVVSLGVLARIAGVRAVHVYDTDGQHVCDVLPSREV